MLVLLSPVVVTCCK